MTTQDIIGILVMITLAIPYILVMKYEDNIKNYLKRRYYLLFLKKEGNKDSKNNIKEQYPRRPIQFFNNNSPDENPNKEETNSPSIRCFQPHKLLPLLKYIIEKLK